MSRQHSIFSHLRTHAHKLLFTPFPTTHGRSTDSASRKTPYIFLIFGLPQSLRSLKIAVMVDRSEDIRAYLKAHTRSFKPFYIIFPDWTPQDYEEVCSRIQSACNEAGLSFHGGLPRISTTRNGLAVSSVGFDQRIAAEQLLFERYNQDGLLLLPHQKDPSKPRPSWFQDFMLVPGPHSIGQKLLVVSYRRIKDRVTGGRRTQTMQRLRTEHDEQHTDLTDHDNHQAATAPSVGSENNMPAQESTDSAITDDSMAVPEQLSHSSAVSSNELETPDDGKIFRLFKDLIIHIGTISELERGQLVMRRTFRDPQSWVKSSAPVSFDFGKVCRSLGVTAGWEKELFFFPDVNRDPHSILDEDELQGGIQYLYKQSAKEGSTRSISLFVAADIDDVRALPLDKRGKSVLTLYASF